MKWLSSEQLYECPSCGWIGDKSQMGSDYVSCDDDGDEMWSDHICPGCHTWYTLEDYKEL